MRIKKQKYTSITNTTLQLSPIRKRINNIKKEYQPKPSDRKDKYGNPANFDNQAETAADFLRKLAMGKTTTPNTDTPENNEKP